MFELIDQLEDLGAQFKPIGKKVGTLIPSYETVLDLVMKKVDDTAQQVWSLTQFYSVDFSQSRIGVKSAFSTNAQSRFASVVVDSVLGPPRLARHT